jgi:hypothetical protein
MTRERKTAVFFYMRRCCRCAHVAALETYAGCRRCRALGGGDAGSLGMAVPSQPFTMRLSGRTMDRTICDGGRPGEGDSGVGTVWRVRRNLETGRWCAEGAGHCAIIDARAELVAFQASAVIAAGGPDGLSDRVGFWATVLGEQKNRCRGGDCVFRKATIITTTTDITMRSRCGWRRPCQLTLHHDLIRLIAGICASNRASHPAQHAAFLHHSPLSSQPASTARNPSPVHHVCDGTPRPASTCNHVLKSLCTFVLCTLHRIASLRRIFRRTIHACIPTVVDQDCTLASNVTNYTTRLGDSR